MARAWHLSCFSMIAVRALRCSIMAVVWISDSVLWLLTPHQPVQPHNLRSMHVLCSLYVSVLCLLCSSMRRAKWHSGSPSRWWEHLAPTPFPLPCPIAYSMDLVC